VARGRYDKLASLWSAHIEANAEDAQAYFTLAAAHYKTGNRAEAIRVLENLSARVPHAKEQADAVIAQIKNGTLTVE
jgi:DNA-binding SARP family transcriptional activator